MGAPGNQVFGDKDHGSIIRDRTKDVVILTILRRVSFYGYRAEDLKDLIANFVDGILRAIWFDLNLGII